MRETTPVVHLIGRPHTDRGAIRKYLKTVDGEAWLDRVDGELNDAELLVEFAGRMCYRSWGPYIKGSKLNPNVSRVREDSHAYLVNILRSAHGSVLEHANFNFVLQDVSRVATHELVRHRAGAAMSQESLRYVRLTDIPFEHPEFVRADPMLQDAANQLLGEMESFQELMAERSGAFEEGRDFHTKKVVTSAMRRYAPDGVATTIGWTVNIRALRHVIAMRTDPGAEEEIRRIFDQVASIMVTELPNLLSDFRRDTDGTWRPEFHKV